MFRRLFFFSSLSLSFSLSPRLCFFSPWVKQMHHFSVYIYIKKTKKQKKKTTHIFTPSSSPSHCAISVYGSVPSHWFFSQPGPYPTRAASSPVSSPCAFLLLTVFYSCGVMYNCQTGGRGRRWGEKKKLIHELKSFGYWFLFDADGGKKRTVQSRGEHFFFFFLITTTVEPVGNVGW